MVAQSERGAAVSEDSLLDGSPRPAEERHLSQNALTAYRSASHPSLDHKNPRDGDLGRRQRWLPERVDKVIAFDRLAL